MKLSVSAYRAHASAHKKILDTAYQLNYGSTSASHLHPTATCSGFQLEALSANENVGVGKTMARGDDGSSDDAHTPLQSPRSQNTSREEEDSSNANESDKSPNNRTKSNQRWMKLRTTVQISSAMQKKPPLKREDSFLKRFSTRQIPETQETVEDTGSEGGNADDSKTALRRKRKQKKKRNLTVVNPDENFYFYWLMVVTICLLYNMWALIVRQSFPEFQRMLSTFWICCDVISDLVFILDIGVQLRTGYLEQGLMVYNYKKLAGHYLKSRAFLFDLASLTPLDILQIRIGPQPILRFPRFLKVYRSVKFYYIVESRTVWPNLWRVVNLIHILLILAHWFGCFYYLLSEAEGFQGDWVYPYRPGDYATLSRKYLGSLYWSTLTLTTIGDLPTPETNAEKLNSVDGPRSLPRRGIKSRLLQFSTNGGYVFTIVSYLIGVFIFATIVGQVGNVITNRNANRLEFERLLDGAKTYMRHHKVPGGMKRRVLRWYDYSWSRGRIQGGGDINTALGLLPDKLKTELALHVNLSVLKKVTIFQECQPEFLHDLVLKMKAYIFTPGDSICRKGEVAREMFIIADGILEVLSETCKVLTTMKAGDFFGEIGILNLDGLNKRTADVRSVGYSELFSLSREDVLAAMKDYPEAQEILQSLGRKRLMEVKASARQSHHRKNSRSGNSGVDKGLVGKIKQEAKGLKKVITKSRTHRPSDDEYMELQPLHLKSEGVNKNMLKRMSRVKSHDLSQDDAITNDQASEPIISPLGAGLPLLSRLRLLKEKQDHEDRRHSSSVHVIPTGSSGIKSPPPTGDSSISSLPLLQRVLLLKSKEDHALLSSSQPTSPTTITSTTTARNSISLPGSSSKSMALSSIANKISFRDRLKLHKDVNKDLTIRESRESKEIKDSSEIAEPSSQFSDSVDSERCEAPWSKLKKAAIVRDTCESSSIPSCSSTISTKSRVKCDKDTISKVSYPKLNLVTLHRETKNYSSVDDLSPEYGGLPFVKKLKILNERQKLAELESEIKKRSFSLDIPDTQQKDDTLTRSQSEGSKMHQDRQQSESDLLVAPLTSSSSIHSTNESNETLERRNLKSILKKLSEEVQIPSFLPPKIDSIELKKLMRAPTIEGYAARHSKLAKSVTFDRDTLPSPPGTTGGPAVNLHPPGTGNGLDDAKLIEEQSKMQDIEKYGLHILSSRTNQLKFLKGTFDEDQQYYGEMLVAIKQIMAAQIQEMQNIFQQKFLNFEDEIRNRDQIINQLRAHILDLEKTITTDSSVTDSIETIISKGQSSWDATTTKESRELQNLPASLSPHSRRLSSDDVVLDVESCTDTECESDIGESSEPGYESGEYEYNANWELEMLAAQMRKKRSASLDYSASQPRRRILRGGSADTHRYD